MHDEASSTDKLKMVLTLLAGGLIFIFGALGIADVVNKLMNEEITTTATNSTQVEDFDTTD